MEQAGAAFKHFRRVAGAEIRKVAGSTKEDGPVDSSTAVSIDDQRKQYEYVIGIVQSISSEMRQILSAELSLDEKARSLEAKIKQCGQTLSSNPSHRVEVDVLPPCSVGGVSVSSHVTTIQQTMLPAFDRLLETHSAVSKEINEFKQKKIDYEHYVHKLPSLEQAAQKGKPADIEKLENNKQKLQSSSATYEAAGRELSRTLDQATQDIALELGVSLAALAQANAKALGVNVDNMNTLNAKGPAWLMAAPAFSGAMVAPAVLLQGNTGAAATPSVASGTDTAQLQQQLQEAEARNKAGVSAYEQLRAELDDTLKKLQLAEQRLQQAEVKLAASAASGSVDSNSSAAEEVVELRRRLQEAEQSEQAFQIRINGLERQLASSGVNVKSNLYPEPPTMPAAPPPPPIDMWNPFGEGGTDASPDSSQQQEQPAAAAPVVSSSGDWNPFG